MLKHTAVFSAAIAVGVLAAIGLILHLDLSEAQPPFTVCPQGCPFSSIQAAIESARPGEMITIGPGVYREALIVERGLKLVGAGSEQVRLRAGRGQVAILIRDGQVFLQGLSIAQSGEGLRIEGTAQVALQGVKVERHADSGITVHDKAQLTLLESQVVGNRGSGLLVMDAGRLEIQTASLVAENARHGLLLQGKSRLVIKRVTAPEPEQQVVISRNGLAGLALEGEAEAELTGALVSGNGWGLLARDRARVTMVETVVQGNWGEGIVLKGETYATLESATIRGNGDDGLELQDAATAEIRNSLLEGNLEAGIQVGRGGSLTLVGNTFQGNSACGLRAELETALQGEVNTFQENGVDLCGNVPPTLRQPLVEPTDQTELVVPDDYPSLQEAIDALVEEGTITVRAGTYLGGITITKPLTLRAEVPSQVVLEGRNERAPVISVVAGMTQVALEGLKISGGRTGLELWGSVTLTGVQARGSCRQGALLRGEATVAIVNSAFSENGVGLALRDEARATVLNSTFSSNLREGLSVWDRAGLTLEESLVEGNGEDGVLLALQSTAELRSNEIVGQGGWGIAVWAKPCYPTSDAFTGSVTGGGNVLMDNARGDLCGVPPTLKEEQE